MTRFSYLAVLGFCFVGSAWLEFGLRTQVFRRWRRLILVVAPIVLIFGAWDIYAIGAGHWSFDPQRITGVFVLAGLPIDEVLFFVIIPIASILTLEAVRAVKPWPAGDER